jgi:hypothetical protein
MKYLMLVYQDESLLTEDVREECYAESSALIDDIRSKGKFLGASPLYPTSTATSVRVRDGRTLVTDGPFAETREQLGGFYLIDAANLDDALSIAERIPAARRGTIEVRPVVDVESMKA